MKESGARYQYRGGCHCGRLRWTLETGTVLAEFAPRACDCDFCTRHRAAWVSDPNGSLHLHHAGEHARRFHQGSAQADFLFCGSCGVLVGVTCLCDGGVLRGAVNRNSFDQCRLLGVEVIASPQQLSPEAKLARWSQVWTPTVGA